jgi:hypothetical protein
MIQFRELPEDHPDLAYSPLLRAARLTLAYMVENGPIGITKTKAFKRTFVQWATVHFDWPEMSHAELMRYHKVLNEYDFPPLELLHFLLVELKLGRHYRDTFCLTKRGQDIAKSPSAIFQLLIPFYILQVDHVSYGRFAERPAGNWDTWLNVINVEIENGASEDALFEEFYGRDANWENPLWRELAVFSHCVLKPLEWSGLLSIHQTMVDGHVAHMCFKTPLWRSALVLDTDDILAPAQRH